MTGLPFFLIGINYQIIILKNKNSNMKKLFAIAFIAASLTACNNENKEETTTETAVDSSAMVAPAADTTAPAADTTVAAPTADSAK